METINYWTDEERAILREIHAAPMTPARRTAEYARRLPNRTLNAIHNQTKMLGIAHKIQHRPWTPEACEHLRTLWRAGESTAAIAADLGRTTGSIVEQVRRLGLPRKQSWARVVVTPEMDQAIRAAYASTLVGAGRRVAERFGVDSGWVRSRASALGLTRTTQRYLVPWTPQEDQIVEDAHDRGGVRFVAEQLKKAGFTRSYHAVQCRVHQLGLRWKNREIYNASEVATAMGIDSKTIIRWIGFGYLKARKGNVSDFYKCEEPYHWLIKPVDIRRFLIEHVSRYRLATCDRFWFVAMLSNTTGVGHIQDTCGAGDGGGFDELRIAA